MVKVEINGKKRNFLFDTGASTLISKSLFKELNTTIIHKQLEQDFFNNRDTLRIVSLKELKLGNLIFNDIPVSVVDSTQDWFKCNNIEGIVGSNILRNSIVQISSNANTITITDNRKKLTLNKNDASKLNLNESSNPFIKITLGKVDIMVLFDSGANGFFALSNNMMNKIMIGEKSKPFETLATGFGANTLGIFGAEKNTERYRLKIPILQINNSKFENVIIETSSTIQSNIGAALLNYGIVTIDYLDKKFYIVPYENIVKSENKKWPISPTFINGKLAVGVIWGKLKDQINIGDQIVAIDSTNFEKVDMCNYFSISKLKDKDKAILTIKDKNGSIKQIEIFKE